MHVQVPFSVHILVLQVLVSTVFSTVFGTMSGTVFVCQYAEYNSEHNSEIAVLLLLVDQASLSVT